MLLSCVFACHHRITRTGLDACYDFCLFQLKTKKLCYIIVCLKKHVVSAHLMVTESNI